MITEASALSEWQKRALAQAPGRTALDLEANSLHHYREKLCLIQYADEQGVEIIDPLTSKDMTPFTEWLCGAQVWMHGADYDMSLFLQTFGTLPKLILDTQVAARLLGFEQFSLAALVEHFFGITLSKKNQKADWGRRPIPKDMQQYARGDVAYMLDMADRLVSRLHKLGRYDWFTESCRRNMQRARQRHLETDTAECWRIRGSGKLNRRGLAALRTLWQWRAAEAEHIDRPPFVICKNDELLRRAMHLQEFRTLLPQPRWSSARRARFLRAVRRFQLLDEEEYPPLVGQTHHSTGHRAADINVDPWLARRDNLAAELHLEPCVIATRGQLEALALNPENGRKELMLWQRKLLLTGDCPPPAAAHPVTADYAS